MIINDTVALVLKELEERGLIYPSFFQIDSKLLDKYESIYNRITGGNGKAKSSNSRFNRKIAAMNLIKYKKALGITITEGFVYIISNPAWPGMCKVGMTSNVSKRLASYQTYSPKRDYVLKHWSFWEDRREAEKFVLSISRVYSHEWISLESSELEAHLAKINQV